MKASAWTITGVLVVLAVVAAWFFGLDERHAVILVGAALAGGVANGLLEAVHLPRAVLPASPEPARGLTHPQSLEFSLSSAEPGSRVVLEVHLVGTALARSRPGAPRSPALDAFLAQRAPTALSHREITAFLDELDRLALYPGLLPHPAASPRDTEVHRRDQHTHSTDQEPA